MFDINENINSEVEETKTSENKPMEKKNANGHSIDELIADGPELAKRLEKVRKGRMDIRKAVSPYLQLVVDNERDEFTGIKTSEI